MSTRKVAPGCVSEGALGGGGGRTAFELGMLNVDAGVDDVCASTFPGSVVVCVRSAVRLIA